MNFNGFNIYREFTNGTLMVVHIVDGNTFADYRLAIELAYESWKANVPNTADVLVFMKGKNGQALGNCIFHGRDIGTENEFDRDRFQFENYGV